MSASAMRLQLNASQGMYDLVRQATGAAPWNDGQERKTDSPDKEKKTEKSQQKEIDTLKKQDSDVRRHEAAHLAAAGGYARGGANFTLTRGPDGQMYATGGEVSIDISPVPNNPEATYQKALIVQRAALAPADPSPQDRSVAAAASQMANQAQREIATEGQKNIQKYLQNSGGQSDENGKQRLRIIA